MTTGKFTLVIRWPSGQSTLCGEMTDHQHGEICRILSPDHRAELSAIKGGGEAVELPQVLGRDHPHCPRHPLIADGFRCGADWMRRQVAALGPLYTHPPVVAEAEPVALAIPDEAPHMIMFDDTEREPIMFAGTGAREAALKTWEKISGSWNAHLFVRIERNSRDDRYPSAVVAPPASGAVPHCATCNDTACEPRDDEELHPCVDCAAADNQSAGAVPVPRELLTVACSGGNEAWQALEEIRALLVKGVA